MGNSPVVIKAHYLNAVKKRSCNLFWKLTPSIAEAYAEGAGKRIQVEGEEAPDPEDPDQVG